VSRIKQGGAIAGVLCAVVGGFEGIRQTAYKDPVGIWTICYGETKGVRAGMTATRVECDAKLLASLIEHEAGMLKCLKDPLPSGPHVAFVSFTYNVGVGAFCKSTLAKKANAGDVAAACDELLKWDKAGGITFPGLTRRRQAEFFICHTGELP